MAHDLLMVPFGYGLSAAMFYEVTRVALPSRPAMWHR